MAQSTYTEYQNLDLVAIARKVSEKWTEENTFARSLELRKGHQSFVFYEGPPSANGQPGIHHVMARTIKDIFCRYKTQKGFLVNRRAGWDTHGLPVELGVEKNLGITKEDIGTKISVDEYNKACRQEVMKYKDMWDQLTREMGYWVDLENPYITFKNEYMETLWYLIGELYKKGFLYKGYTIQPFSPAAGTGLSSHELNMPGCYRDVKDTTAVAQFKVSEKQTFSVLPLGLRAEFLHDVYFLAWTTTPWTLPSNTALAVGPGIKYVLVQTFNPYTGEPIRVILAESLLHAYFPEKNAGLAMDSYEKGNKDLPFEILDTCMGTDLVGIEYEQLIPWVIPEKPAFRVILGDYVTTEDGTGIVHIAPTFGADDDRVAKQADIPPLVLLDKNKQWHPMVDRTGKFFNIEDLDETFVKERVNTELYSSFAGRFVKNAYDADLTDKDPSLDVDICVWLKQQNKVFKIEKHTHNYPHCWRTDKPILYYPLDSWFIRTTAVKDRLIALNKTIHWKPETTGSGRFGHWLENLVDWNLSRSRYWGTPLPIWRTEDGTEERCIGSVDELRQAIEASIKAGFMTENPYADTDYAKFDLHRPYIDKVILVSERGQKMYREPDLIDVWFDSGAMPYAQEHYPFTCEDKQLKNNFPADFIAEGVDQTRGWFFTLHTIATMLFDSVAFKNVVSNGLVLDKNGNKMSKRLGNAIDPFATIREYGPDATRWYMISNSQPWENLKFDVKGIDEVRRKFFGTLYNTYSFFALYANIDHFTYREPDIAIENRPEIDRWILSELNTLIEKTDEYYNDYEPTKAARALQQFVDEYLSNWYVRLCRRRFWKGEYNEDKISAYQTLYRCLEVLSQLSAPIAPFFSEQLFCDLNNLTHRHSETSVHHTSFPTADTRLIDHDLEERMQLAQQICSMVLSLRKRSNLRVRQPLSKIMFPVASSHQRYQVEAVKDLILSEVNVKMLDLMDADNNILVKTIKPNFKTLGPRYGKMMKSIAARINSMTTSEISTLENRQPYTLMVDDTPVDLTKEDVEIFTQDIPGWIVANEGSLTVALDIDLTPELVNEGLARELVNRIQNLRKNIQLDVTDKIKVSLQYHPDIEKAVLEFREYICSETLTEQLQLENEVGGPGRQVIDILPDTPLDIQITKV